MSVAYQSEQYALLNTPVETDRHVMRVMRHLAPTEADRILEVGCGRGFVTARVQRISPLTEGVDVNPEAVRHGVAANLRAMSATGLDFPDASFDKVYSFHTIEHVPDLGRALGEMARVLRPGGRLMLVYPAEPIRGLYAVPAAVALFHNPLRAREMHLHRLTPTRILAVIESHELALAHVASKLELWLTPQFVTVLARRP
jgi:ubiquinone/menaquinone biosynthesis C-methylase UbiE